MEDIKIFKKCKNCNHWLTLMESMRMGNNETYLGVRCLNCGWSGFTELWKIFYKPQLEINLRNPFDIKSKYYLSITNKEIKK